MFENLFKGILIGLMFGVPIGAVGTLTISRTWEGGRKAGLLTGLGSSAADCIYAVIGVFGLTVLSDFLTRFEAPITAVGGAFVLYLGISTLTQKKNTEISAEQTKSSAKTFLSSFFIGITNPAAILTFLIAFTYFDIGKAETAAEGMSLVLGVLIGTFLWWTALTELTLLLKRKDRQNRLQNIQKLLAWLLVLFGILIFGKLIREIVL